MFEKTRREEGTIHRSDGTECPVKVERIAPKLENVRLTYLNGLKVDFEGYINKSCELKLFDVLEVAGKKYKLAQVTEYSSFYYVVGEEWKNDQE